MRPIIKLAFYLSILLAIIALKTGFAQPTLDYIQYKVEQIQEWVIDCDPYEYHKFHQ
jgi:hypothetical protein